jgi:hypothetical protein
VKNVDVSRVEQVEYAIREDDFFGERAPASEGVVP